jgi:hypothetical protein
MNASLYKVRLVGGPVDGLVLSDLPFNVRNKLQMPSSPAAVRCRQTDCYELAEYWSTYVLTSTHRTTQDGHLIAYLRYDFLGYELLETQAERDSPRQCALRWFIGLGTWLAQVPRGLAKWMLEPIDYPLKVCNEEAAFNQRA